MKKALIAAVALSFVLAVAAFAADSSQPGNVPVQSFDQRKTDILKMIDERLANLQEARTCIQAAKNNEDIKSCRDKHRAEMMEKRGEMQRGMGGPGAPMGR